MKRDNFFARPDNDATFQYGLAQAQELKRQQAESLMMSGYQYGASSFAQLMSSKIDYDLLKVNAMQQETQAKTIEVQAKEQANMIREQFNQAVGNAQVMGAQRGVKAGEGSLQANIEGSSANLGKDIQKLDENAQAKARVLRAQASIDKRIGKAQFVGGLLDAVGTGMTGYSQYSKGKKLKETL